MSATSIEETPATEAPAPEAAPIADAPAPDPVAADPAPAADPAVRTFRGRTLEELLPQIREQLGPDAVIVRQRDGLMGGIGGFFQQRFVEVDAKPGGPRIDVYDEQPPPTPESFAALLADAEESGAAEPLVMAAAAAPALERPAQRSQDDHNPGGFEEAAAPALTSELTAQGMSHAFAERLIEDATAHELPFAADERAAVRRALARRLPAALPHRAGGLAVAFAGPGATACADALATAYKRAGRDARHVASLDRARALIERGDAEQVLAIDLPPVAAERDEAKALAARIAPLGLDDLLVVVPADLDLPSARALLDRLRPLAPTGLALSLDAEGARLAAALELACATRLPILYVQDGAGIAPADPHTLAERLLP